MASLGSTPLRASVDKYLTPRRPIRHPCALRHLLTGPAHAATLWLYGRDQDLPARLLLRRGRRDPARQDRRQRPAHAAADLRVGADRAQPARRGRSGSVWYRDAGWAGPPEHLRELAHRHG